MSKRIIRGKFKYEGGEQKKKSKKEKRKEELRLLKQKDKEIIKRCQCNHIDRDHGKTHFKTSDDGMFRICKICGGKIHTDPEMLSKDSVIAAHDVIYSVLSIARNRLAINEETDDEITKALRIISRCPDLVERLMNEHKDSYKNGKKKKKKNKKGKKKDKNKFYRVSY